MKKAIKMISILLTITLVCTGSYYAYKLYETDKRLSGLNNLMEKAAYNYELYSNGYLENQSSNLPALGHVYDVVLAEKYYDLYQGYVPEYEEKLQEKQEYEKITTGLLVAAVVFFIVSLTVKVDKKEELNNSENDDNQMALGG